MSTRNRLPDGAYVWYIIINILTWGLFYFLKVAIMKAIIDSREDKENG